MQIITLNSVLMLYKLNISGIYLRLNIYIGIHICTMVYIHVHWHINWHIHWHMHWHIHWHIQWHTYIYRAMRDNDLERQLKVTYCDYQVITDICSGINFKRPGPRTLLGWSNYQGMVDKFGILHKYRFARFGKDWLAAIFQKFGFKLMVQCKRTSEDLHAIVNVFVASNNGRRAEEEKKKERAIKAAEKCRKKDIGW